MTITEARSIVKDFVGQWSDQKLCEVLAFAEDGKMDYVHSCQCLEGVARTSNLHLQSACPDCIEHWKNWNLSGPTNAERAYRWLSSSDRLEDNFGQVDRDREFIAILNSVIAERDAQRANADEAQPVETAQGSAK